ncbi:type II toxin-antitoxin system HicB family antitoxin, partial [Burkholderia sp. SIMBA_048]|uniref:type II toxin-antitoxin system HicB family antitoxin n=1 Tax=Burkholderia sp. SIMBA_048 TaxID=3085789 RepID=UPI003979DC22
SGATVPAPTSIATHQSDPAFKGWVWEIVDVDPAVMDESVERVNITLPRRILKRLDDRARAAGESRSGFIAHMALIC